MNTGYNTFEYLQDSSRSDNWLLLNESTAPAWSFSNGSAVGDTAILTIPSSTSASIPAGQQALFISTAPPVINSSLAIWGWGRRLPTDPAPAGDLLTGSGGAQITVAGTSGSGDGQWLCVYALNNARLCDGDSGDPQRASAMVST